MTIEEATQKREVLLAEQRRLNQAVKILKSESIPENAGTKYAISEYERRVAEIDNELVELANSVETVPAKEEKSKFTIEFDFEGAKVYPVNCIIRFQSNPINSDLMTWDSEAEAEAFARWYAYKHGFKVVPAEKVGLK